MATSAFIDHDLVLVAMLSYVHLHHDPVKVLRWILPEQVRRHVLATSDSLVDNCFRITNNRIHHWIMYTAMFITAMTGVAFFFVTILQCTPVNYWWKQVDPTVKGSCINIKAISNVSYAYSAASILTDFIFTFLPIHIVMSLQMDLKTKLALVPIFAMATLASIACVIRIAYLPKFTAVDFLCEYFGATDEVDN